MSGIRVIKSECDACNATVDIPEGMTVDRSIPEGWTRVVPTYQGGSNTTSPVAGKSYFDLCEECTIAWINEMDEFLEQWGK